MPDIPEGLVCTHCGAPLPQGAGQRTVACSYCGTLCAPPPRVVERVVERVQVVRAKDASAADSGTLLCPRCGEALREARSGEAVARCCRSCSGAWLEAATVAHLVARRDEELERAVRFAVPIRMPVRLDLRARISCPVCQAVLARVDVPETGQDMHVCQPHGVWFDRGGLESAIRVWEGRRAGSVEEDDLEAAGIPRKLWGR